MLRLTEALERVSQAQVDGAKIIASEHRRANRPSNEVIPGLSVFNRRGTLLPDDAPGPRKPPLKCLMLIPWLAEWESCTREEVELLNLLEPGDYTLALQDRSKVKMQVKVNYKADGVSLSRLTLCQVDDEGNPGSAFRQGEHRNIPALSDLLRYLLKQHRLEVRALAAAVMTDEEEEALIEAGALSVSM